MATATIHNVEHFENRSNASHLRYDAKGDVIGFTNGNSGGTITFHSHSCEPKKAVEELLNELK